MESWGPEPQDICNPGTLEEAKQAPHLEPQREFGLLALLTTERRQSVVVSHPVCSGLFQRPQESNTVT